MIIELSRIAVYVQSLPLSEYDYDDSVTKRVLSTTTKQPAPIDGRDIQDIEKFCEYEEKKKREKNETEFYPCDKKADLYSLNRDFIWKERFLAHKADDQAR
jgi:hypothetical protein